MDLEEYEKIALQRLNETIASSDKERMNYACMGLVEETGEIVAELRKPLFKGNFHEKKINIEQIKNELGDLMWYIVLICKDSDIDIQPLKQNEEETQLSMRENLIQLGIKLGKLSGEIVEKCQQVYNERRDNRELSEKINEQYTNILGLANQLNLTLEEILDDNVKKINSRYKENEETSR